MISNLKGAFKEFNVSILNKWEDFLSAEIDCCINIVFIDAGDKKRDEY